MNYCTVSTIVNHLVGWLTVYLSFIYKVLWRMLLVKHYKLNLVRSNQTGTLQDAPYETRGNQWGFLILSCWVFIVLISIFKAPWPDLANSCNCITTYITNGLNCICFFKQSTTKGLRLISDTSSHCFSFVLLNSWINEFNFHINSVEQVGGKTQWYSNDFN